LFDRGRPQWHLVRVHDDLEHVMALTAEEAFQGNFQRIRTGSTDPSSDDFERHEHRLR
jgi:hypothetical protein